MCVGRAVAIDGRSASPTTKETNFPRKDWLLVVCKKRKYDWNEGKLDVTITFQVWKFDFETVQAKLSERKNWFAKLYQNLSRRILKILGLIKYRPFWPVFQINRFNSEQVSHQNSCQNSISGRSPRGALAMDKAGNRRALKGLFIADILETSRKLFCSHQFFIKNHWKFTTKPLDR